jgi:ankyrin repeat protein
MEHAAELIDAVKAGSTDAVARLLDGDPALANAADAEGRSALLLAAYHRQPAVADLLLARGAAVGAAEAAARGDLAALQALAAEQTGFVAAHTADGATPLHLAVYFGHPAAAAWLLESGADANAAGRAPFPATLRPLHSAVAHRGPDAARESVRLLLSRGADVNVAQDGGYTPLHQAAAHGDAVIVDMLLEAGADPAARTTAGETAADLAAARGFPGAAPRLGAGIGA